MPATAESSCANLEIPKGQSPANRSDIEVLFEELPEPIDLDLDLNNRADLLDRIVAMRRKATQ